MHEPWFFSSHIFQSKMRLSIKTTVYVHIGALNLLPNSRSPPVAQWLHFRASVRKDMVSAPIGGLLFFSYLCWTPFFFRAIFFFFVSTKLGMKRSFKKGQETWLTVKCIQLIIYFLMSAVFISLYRYPVGEDLQKNGP